MDTFKSDQHCTSMCCACSVQLYTTSVYVEDPGDRKPVLILPNGLSKPGERAPDRNFTFCRGWDSDPQSLVRHASVLPLSYHRSLEPLHGLYLHRHIQTQPVGELEVTHDTCCISPDTYKHGQSVTGGEPRHVLYLLECLPKWHVCSSLLLKMISEADVFLYGRTSTPHHDITPFNSVGTV